LYYQAKTRPNEAELCQELMEIYERYPMYGYRRITAMLRRKGIMVNRKCVYRLMKLLGLRAVYPGPNTSKRNHAEMVWPYLLGGLSISHLHQVWQIDITYIRVEVGFVYWRLSNDLSTAPCCSALAEAIENHRKPEIVNSDQGSQFTSSPWIEALTDASIKISMTGKGRSNDNAHVERLWRTFKYEGIYLHNYKTIKELKKELPKLIHWYNHERPHQALSYLTPAEVSCAFMDKLTSNLPTITQAQQQL
jgi:putative transposase